ncbi:MAG: septum formation protein Maf [Bacteroidetes bacterium HGW-Bacteroidetes-8]|jgi:septum formation protein|nr:MAG: septum formation protein Maf [Bacteroidetes bacterium HGW-Bacteroidetes-8]
MKLLIDLVKDYRVTLASASPRRSELISGLRIPFTVEINSETGEEYSDSSHSFDVPLILSLRKSLSFGRELDPKEILITADTLVICDNLILGKPINREEACSMLRLLSSKAHKVVTGVTLRSREKTESFSCETTVYFREISDREIEFYVDNFSPYDKAGAYGVQEWIGFTAISKIEGSYYNVMGLPVQKLSDSLCAFILSL